MSKCFISYRHVKPDEDLAAFLESFLIKHNHEVFIDTKIPTGARWEEEIEKHLRSAENFVVLLSKESIRSDMVREEVKSAYQEMKKRKDKYRIFPIRVDYNGELPYELGAYLNPTQYTQWKPGDNFETIARQVLNAIEKNKSLPLKGKSKKKKVSISGMQKLFDATDAIGAPLPAADPRFPIEYLNTVSVKLDSPFYIKREADKIIMNQIQQRGSTTRVKGSRQMGKSSLLARAHAEAQKINYQSYYLDLRILDDADLSDLETVFKVLADELSEDLKTSITPGDVWKSSRGPKRNLTWFIEKALLETTQTQVLILFDDVDRLFDYPFRNDFFSTLRHWHERRSRKDCWNRLNLVIAHSTEPYLWIQNIEKSPFNVGNEIVLEDLDYQQVAELNTKHHNPLREDKEIHELLELTGGQPYLVRSALYKMVTDHWSLSELKKTAADYNWPFTDHLRQLTWNLQRDKGLSDSLRQVLLRGKCIDEMHFLRLRSAGLIRGKTMDHVQMRCQLYDEYLRNHL